MVFVINHELKMGKGKIAAQVGHAAVKATLQSGELRPELLDAWLCLLYTSPSPRDRG